MRASHLNPRDHVVAGAPVAVVATQFRVQRGWSDIAAGICRKADLGLLPIPPLIRTSLRTCGGISELEIPEGVVTKWKS